MAKVQSSIPPDPHPYINLIYSTDQFLSKRCDSCLTMCISTFILTYRIAGKFDGELNLAVWRSILQLPN